MQIARSGCWKPEPVQVVDVVAVLVAHQPRRRGECADVGESINDQVVKDRAGGLRARPSNAHSGHPHQDVAGVGDRRVRQHPLEVLAAQRREVAVGHRDGRDHRDDPDPARPEHARRRVRPGQKRVQEHLHHARRSWRASSRSRSRPPPAPAPLVCVGRPLVERHRRDLEPEAHQHEQDRHRPGHVARRGRRVPPVSEQLLDPVELGRAGHAVDQAQAEEEERRRHRAVDEILEPRLRRAPPGFFECRAEVQADRHRLERQEERDQLLRGGQEHHSDRRPEQKREVLAPAPR